MSFAAYADGMSPFATKKSLRETVARGDAVTLVDCAFIRPQTDIVVRMSESSPGRAGTYHVEGPDPLAGVPNRWYATVTIDNNGRVRVK